MMVIKEKDFTQFIQSMSDHLGHDCNVCGGDVVWEDDEWSDSGYSAIMMCSACKITFEIPVQFYNILTKCR